MRRTLLATALAAVAMIWTTPVFAACDLAADAVVARCGCATNASGTTWRNHGVYAACVQQTLADMARAGETSQRCRAVLFRCAARSVCGRAGAVVCVKDGRCHLVASAERCLAKGGTVSAAQSCCDA